MLQNVFFSNQIHVCLFFAVNSDLINKRLIAEIDSRFIIFKEMGIQCITQSMVFRLLTFFF